MTSPNPGQVPAADAPPDEGTGIFDANADTESPLVAANDDPLSTLNPTPHPDGTPQVLRVGEYEILGRLGRGGMGVVYKARQAKLDRLVALKMILAGAHASPADLARFHTESRVIARLHHPNIVQLYEAGEYQGLPYFCLEYVDGDSLAQRLGGQPQAPRDAAQLAETLARAIAAAHEHNIVHRDLKPANVLFTANGVPKIVDFGLAKRLEGDSSITHTGSLMGTPSYMAPEQARGDNKAVTAQTDVYALGAILYECLTGRPPFLGKTPMKTAMKVLNEEPMTPTRLQPGLPRDLETICLKCLEKELPRRYSSASALAEDLHRFLAGESILARPAGAAKRLWRWAGRNPRVAALAATVLLLLLTVAVGSTAAAVRIRQQQRIAEQNAVAARLAQSEAEANARTAEANARAAEANAQLANEQAGLSLETLSNLLTSVRQMKDTPGTQQLRQQFAREALDKLQRIAPGLDRTATTDLNKAEAHRFVGVIYLELGRVKEARPHFEQCRAIMTRLAAAGDGDPAARRNLTVAYNVLGDFYLLTGDTPAARELYREAHRHRQALFNVDPTSAPAKVDLATSLVKLGNASPPDEATRYYADALTLRTELAVSRPNGAGLRRDVWIVCNHLGDLCLREKNAPAGKDWYRQGLKWAEEYVALARRANKLTVAISHEKLGTACRLCGETGAAEKHFNTAVVLLRPLARDETDNLSVQAAFMLLLARSGAHAEAASRAVDLQRLAPDYANNLYNIACCYALCADAVPPDHPDSQNLRQRYATDAVKSLAAALGMGFSNLTLLRTDPDLNPVRDNPAFAALLAKKL